MCSKCSSVRQEPTASLTGVFRAVSPGQLGDLAAARDLMIIAVAGDLVTSLGEALRASG